MDSKDKKDSKRLLIEELIKELEVLYISKFEKLAQVNEKEALITKLSQLFLISRESAIKPLKQELNQEKSFGQSTGN